MSDKHKYVISIDFGSTLTYRLSEHEERVLFPNALETVRWLASQWPIHIVSKVNEVQQKEVENWLLDNEFLKKAGIPVNNVHFCANRTDKFAICKTIGATHHIDDRPEVFSIFDKSIESILFRPVAEDVVKYFNLLKYLKITICQTWEQIERQFLDYTNFPFS